MVLVLKYMIPKDFVGLTLWPLIILKRTELRQDRVLLNHERIHLRQQLELLILPFFLWYLAEWLYGLYKYRDARMAYRQISFEQEAYANDTNLDYLRTRRVWQFLRYLRPHVESATQKS